MNRKALAIPENAPAVAFDINLGKQYQHVDFDYEAFDIEATRLGISDENKSKLQINVQETLPGHKRGSASRNNDRIELKAGPKINKAASHEMQHYADRVAGVKYNERRYAIGMAGVKGVRGLIPALVAGDIEGSIGSPAGHLAEQLTSYGISYGVLPAIGIFGTAAVVGYAMHPGERRARKVARQRGPDIISLQKK